MKGMILAAGLGTRFRPATFDLPKPLVPLCNEPLIGYAIRNLLANGVREIAINLHHLPDELRSAVVETFGADADFEFSFEPEILGTGGGIRKLRSWLESDDDFVLVNGDTVQQPPLERLAARRRASNTIAALLLRKPPAGDRFTKVFFDDGFITGFKEGHGEALMFAGAHVISRRVFDLLPDRDFSGITEDVYLPLTKESPTALSAIVDDGFWFDIGTPLRYRSASDAMLQLMIKGDVRPQAHSRVEKSSVIHRTAQVHGNVQHSAFGANVVVAAGAHVHESSLWDGATVDAHADIRGSIIGRAVQISAHSRVENVLLCNRRDVEYPEETILTSHFAATKVDPDAPHRLDID